LVKEFIVPLEKQISSEQEEKQMAEKETQEIVGQKRRARTCTGTSSSASKEMVAAGGTRRRKRVKVAVKVSAAYYVPAEEESSLEAWSCACTGTSSASSASKEQMVAAGGTRRSKRVKVAPTRYVPVVEEELWTTSPHASSGVVTRYATLTASRPPLENSSATTDETTMNGNEDTNIGSSRSVSAVAAATMVHKGSKVQKTFDERFKDLMSFKAEFGSCNVPRTRSRNNKDVSLGIWCNNMRRSYKAIKEGRSPRQKLSKANIQRLENTGFQWNPSKNVPFDERLKDLMAFKAEFGHCNVPQRKPPNYKYYSLAMWCNDMRKSYKAIKVGRNPGCRLSKADIQRLENAGFEWHFSKKVPFDERFKHLMAFKAEFGHCNVPQTRSINNKYPSLGSWCYDIRRSYKTIKQGGIMRLRCNISKTDIQRLEKAGFHWH
jgi:hypothetical protein